MCAHWSIAAILIGLTWWANPSARAQPLADKLPASTLLYYAWTPDASLLTTPAARMLADERVREPLTRLAGEIGNEILGKSGLGDQLPRILQVIGTCPTVFAILDVKADGRQIEPSGVLVVTPGLRRAELEKLLAPINDRLKQTQGQRFQMMKVGDSFLWVIADRKDRPRVTWGFVGDLFVVHWGADAQEMLNTILGQAPQAHALADDATFRAAMTKVPGPAVLTSYSSGSRLREIVQQTLVTPARAPWHWFAPQWTGIVREIGLENLSAIVEKTVVDQGRFVTHGQAILNQAPTGLLAALVRPTVDAAFLKAVPSDAMAVVAGRADLQTIYNQVKASADTVWGKQADDALKEFEDSAQSMGIAVNDLFQTIGDQWVIYNAASTGGFALTGWTLVGEVRDAERFARTEAAIRRLIVQQLGGNAQTLDEYQAEGTTIHFVRQRGFFPMSPAWAVTQDRFVVALYPQLVEAALAQLRPDHGLMDDPTFAEVWKQSGAGGPTVYVSQPQVVRNLYPLGLVVLTAISSYDQTFPAQGIPSLPRLLAYVGPELATLRQSDDGYQWTLVQSNPMLSPVTFASPHLWLLGAFPALLEARGNDELELSTSYMRSVGQAMLMYSNEHKGRFPPDLDTLVDGSYIPPQTLVSPFSDTGERYVYLYFDGLNPRKTPAEVIIMYDKASLTSEDATMVLFADGHTEWLDRAAFTKAVTRSRQLEPKSAPAALLP